MSSKPNLYLTVAHGNQLISKRHFGLRIPPHQMFFVIPGFAAQCFVIAQHIHAICTQCVKCMLRHFIIFLINGGAISTCVTLAAQTASKSLRRSIHRRRQAPSPYAGTSSSRRVSQSVHRRHSRLSDSRRGGTKGRAPV
jgi:hypothetical protein